MANTTMKSSVKQIGENQKWAQGAGQRLMQSQDKR